MGETLVPASLAIIGFIVWLARLESKNSSCTKDLDRVERRQDNHEHEMGQLDLRMMDKLSKIEQMVAKIEGSLDRERFN